MADDTIEAEGVKSPVAESENTDYVSRKLYEFKRADGVIHTADTTDLLAVAQHDLIEVFGQDLTVESTTIAGRLCEWVAVFMANALRVNMQNANQLLLSSAAGQQLDNIAQWFRLERKGAEKTQVKATVYGDVGTTLPVGTRARTIEGDLFRLEHDVTIGGEGSATADFRSLEYGPVKCPKNTLTIMDTSVSGWTMITNEEDGTSGRHIETDEQLRARIADNRIDGVGFIGAIKNAIESVEGVSSSMVIENNTSHEMDVHGIPMAPHSIFVCVDGVNDNNKDDIAAAIFNTKPCGTGYTRLTGTTAGSNQSLQTVNHTDDYGNEYAVYFHTPEDADISMTLTVARRTYAGSDLEADVEEAVKLWFDEAEYMTGETVYASDIIMAVEHYLTGIAVVSAHLSDGGAESSRTEAEEASEATKAMVGSYVEVAANKKAKCGTVKIVEI